MRTSVVVEGREDLDLEVGAVRFVGAAEGATVAVARGEVDDGADRIELCGGYGPVAQAAVQAAVPEARVGAVMYGFESLEATVGYKRRFERGDAVREAFLYAGEDGRVDRVGSTVVAAVAGPDDAARRAAALVGEGVTLFELYGGLGPEVAAAVATAVDGRASVGLALYPET